MTHKKLIAIIIAFLGFFTWATPAYAHIIVTPSQAGIGSSQTFDLVAHNDTTTTLTGARILVPDGVTDIAPDVIPGWTITMKTSGTGDNVKVTEIDWTGGSVPAGDRLQFTFGATVPAAPTNLVWKSYTTYGDGTTMSWDQTPNPNITDAEREAMEKKMMGPASQTIVINDLQPTPASKPVSGNSLPQTLNYIAIALSAVALGLALRKQ